MFFSFFLACLAVCAVYLCIKHTFDVSLDTQRVSLELVVADYDRIGSSDPIGRVECGYNRKGNMMLYLSANHDFDKQ